MGERAAGMTRDERRTLEDIWQRFATVRDDDLRVALIARAVAVRIPRLVADPPRPSVNWSDSLVPVGESWSVATREREVS